MAVLIVIPRALSSGAASISSYFLGALFPIAARAMVKAAVRVVLPWSTWPMVPMLRWGFLRSNFPRAARTMNERRRLVETVTMVVVKGGRKEEEEERWDWVTLEGKVVDKEFEGEAEA